MKHREGQQPYLSLKNIDRFFGITKALQNVSLDIYEGEVIGLVGPNGAGKSTLMKILTGVLPRTNGEIYFQGQLQDNYNAKTAKQIGINCAYQDLSLCTNLSVFENFAMLNVGHGLAPEGNWRRKAMSEAKELLEKYFPGSGIDVTKPIEQLSLTDQQVVEICKTLMSDNLKVLVLDEPTSALSTDKARQLHAIVKELSAKGVAIIYISHKLDEIGIVSDRINILSNGKNTGEFFADTISKDELVNLMGGAAEKKERVSRDFSAAETMLKVTGLTNEHLNDIHMELKKGEIIGISGLAGSGQQELLQTIYANRKKSKPGLEINGTIAYVSGDRAKEGVFHFWDIRNNILAANFDRVKGKILIDRKKADSSAQEWYDKLKFRAEGINSNIMSLSGGNQQKALIARGIASEADIIILNDPTAGVDIGTKQDMYALLDEIRDMGKSVILFSTEDNEMENCDRVYVMRDGYVVKELVGDEIDVPNIVKASFIETEKKNVEEKKESKIATLLRERWMLPLLTLIVIYAANVIINPNLASYIGLRMKISSALPLVFAALGQMFIVMCGDVDMGNGYSIGLVNCIVAIWLTGSPLIGVLGLVVFVAAYMGMAALIKIRQIPAIVVTLGTQFVWYGLALLVCPLPGGSCPTWISNFLRLQTPVIPFPIILAAIVGVICWYLLFRCRYGVVLRGIGNNQAAVERSGWSYILAKVVAYAIAGLFVVMAAIVMNLINSLLTALKMNSNYQTAIIGLILIGVLALKYFMRRGERVSNV